MVVTPERLSHRVFTPDVCDAMFLPWSFTKVEAEGGEGLSKLVILIHRFARFPRRFAQQFPFSSGVMSTP